MNIFILSEDAKECAKMMCDKHVVKMPTESMQMISTILHHHGIDSPYKPVMLNHPCTIWARESKQNFSFLWEHCFELCKEYKKRYGKVHKVEETLQEYASKIAEMYILLPDIGLTPFAVAISEDMNCRGIENFNDMTVVEQYRQYYLEDKWYMAKWKTSPPTWWPKQHAENKRRKLKLLYSDTIQRLRNLNEI